MFYVKAEISDGITMMNWKSGSTQAGSMRFRTPWRCIAARCRQQCEHKGGNQL
jgi:hypothetical protein